MVKLTLPLISDDTPVKLGTDRVSVMIGPSPTTFSHEGKITSTTIATITADVFFIVFCLNVICLRLEFYFIIQYGYYNSLITCNNFIFFIIIPLAKYIQPIGDILYVKR